MATRYHFSTCLSFGTDGEADYCELDVTVSYTVAWGRPETPPAYDHGGLPAEPDEIDDIRLELVNDCRAPFFPFDGHVEESAKVAEILARFEEDDGLRAAMLEEAAEREAA